MFWLLLTFVFILIDQLSKELAARLSWPIFYNHNFAFSLPVPDVLMYTIYFAVMCAIAFYIYRSWHRFDNLQKYAWCLVGAGGISNVMERIFSGSVKDFIPLASGMLNVADFFILTGLMLLLISQRYSQKLS